MSNLREWCTENNREDLLDEWDKNKNSILPDDLSRGSDKKVSWICPKGHSYIASVLSRTRENTGCPYCSGRRTLSGYNDLETWCKKNAREDILKEWDYDKNKISPSEISRANNIKVSWICPKGHHYDARIGNRTIQNNGCPYCSNHKVLKGLNDLETWCQQNNREDILKEWDYDKNTILPSEITSMNGKKVWWKCSLGHSYDSTIGSRTAQGSGCPYCSNPPKRILIGFNDLESWCKNNNRADLLDEWDYEKNVLTPLEVSFGSGKAVWWKCSVNHSWKSIIGNRTKEFSHYCPICNRNQTSLPEQIVAFYIGKEYKTKQRHKIFGREVDVFIPQLNIAIEYDGQMWHSGQEKIKKDSEKSQEIIKQDVILIRLKESNKNLIRVNADKKLYIIEFIAKRGIYTTENFKWAIERLFETVNSITGNSSIPNIDIRRDELEIRSHYMYALKSNSVSQVFPELLTEWDYEKNEGILPEAYSSRTNTKVWWKCSKGHSWQAAINTRGVRKLGCPYCAGQRTVTGTNDFKMWAILNKPNLLEEWNYEKNTLLPEDIPQSYKEKMWWKCSEGHEWQATVYNRVNGTGCPICNTGRNTIKKLSLLEWCKKNNSSLCDEWDYEKNEITPDKVLHGSHKKVWWKCAEGHNWEAQIKSRTYNHGCPFCSGTNKKAVIGINDLKTWCKQNDKEYILEEWDYDNNDITPEMVTFGSHKRIKWKCKHGHSWEAVIKERTKINGNMCPICRTL